MKKYILSLFVAACLPLTVWSQSETDETVYVEINETNFPDANLRTVVETFDTDSDEKLSEEEIVAVTKLNVSNKSITDLKGVEFFTAITTLNCSYNSLTTLDISKNVALTSLSCNSNQISTLDISYNTALKSLNCSKNNLESLDLSNNNNLTSLDCSENKIETLDLTYNTKLTSVRCYKNNMSSLNVSKCENLKTLHCYNNQLTSLDLTDLNKITNIRCDENKLSELIISSEVVKELWCNKNQLTDLNVSKMTVLEDLRCSDNPNIESLEVNSPKLKTLDCYCNNNHPGNLSQLTLNNATALVELRCYNQKIKDLDLSSCSSIKKIDAFNNDLDVLDVSGNTTLTYLGVSGNKLTELDVTKNVELTTLNCAENSISELDLSNNTKLTNLTIHTNKISAIDVTMLPDLVYLTCQSNLLTSLDVTKNPKLKQFRCDENQLTTLDLSNNGDLTFKWNTSTPNYFKISPQNTIIDADAINNRTSVGIEILPSSSESTISIDNISNTKVGIYSATFSIAEDNGKNYLVISDTPNKDVDFYNKDISYTYTVNGPNNKKADMAVSIKTYPYVMYVSPNSKDLHDSFFSGTIYLDYDAVVPEGAECYIAKGILKTRKEIVNNGHMVTFEQLSMEKVADAGQVIPANTPVYVKALTESGLYAFGRNKENLDPVTIPEGNILQGTFKDMKDIQPRQYLTLGRESRQGTGEIGFWPYFGTTIPAHRVYIDASLMTDNSSEESTAGAKGFVFHFDGEATGINQIENTSVENSSDDIWYNLQGMKILEKPSAKGVYIHKGKKIVVK